MQIANMFEANTYASDICDTVALAIKCSLGDSSRIVKYPVKWSGRQWV